MRDESRASPPIECGGVIDDGNVPAFQSGTVLLVAGSAVIPEIYVSPRSWIGLTPITSNVDPADSGHIRVDRQIDVGIPPVPWGAHYQGEISVFSDQAGDVRLLQYVIITAPGMGESYPGQVVG